LTESFGAIYERNAINSAMPIMVAENILNQINDKDELGIDFKTGEIFDKTQNKKYIGKPLSKSQLDIYLRGGLLT